MQKKLIYIILVICFSFVSCGEDKTQDTISILERSILVNDQPYIIRGICYHPVSKGESNRIFSNLEADLKLMKEAHINTIRVYQPIHDKTVLDKIHKANMKIIIGFGYNQNGNYDILSGSYLQYIEKFKNHPAILMWELGNEYNYHPEWFDGEIKNWYAAMNNAANEIKKIDQTHPITTAHGELPDALALELSSSIDVWGMNVYRWDNPEKIFSEWESISDKPMYLSEAGADSYMTIDKLNYAQGVNEKAQADATKNILKSIFNNQNICSGVTLFAFVDELWKAGNNNQLDPGGWAPNSSGVPYDGTPNEEYWGIVTIERTQKQAYYIVKEKYHTVSKNH